MTTVTITKVISDYILERMTDGFDLESITICEDGTPIVKMVGELRNGKKQNTRTLFPIKKESKRASGGFFWEVKGEDDLRKRPAKKSKKVLAK